MAKLFVGYRDEEKPAIYLEVGEEKYAKLATFDTKEAMELFLVTLHDESTDIIYEEFESQEE